MLNVNFCFWQRDHVCTGFTILSCCVVPYVLDSLPAFLRRPFTIAIFAPMILNIKHSKSCLVLQKSDCLQVRLRPIGLLQTVCLPILSWLLNGVGKFIGHAANDWWLQYCTVGCYLKLALKVHYKVGVYVATYPLPTGKLSLWAFEEHQFRWQGQNKMNTCNWREAFFVDFISYVWSTGHINWVIFMGDIF